MGVWCNLGFGINKLVIKFDRIKLAIMLYDVKKIINYFFQLNNKQY